jgi:hypothetical protein
MPDCDMQIAQISYLTCKNQRRSAKDRKWLTQQ